MIGNYVTTIVEGAAPQDVNSAADGNYISMKGYDHCTIVIKSGALAASTAITVNKATAVAGTSETTLAFTEMWTNDGAATLSALTKTTVTANTFDVDVANSMYIIEIPADTIQAGSTTEYDCIQIAFGAAGNTTLVDATYILWKGRYKSTTPIEPLED